MKTLDHDNPMRWLFEDADILEGAWRRVCAWYKGGEWAPQPEFAAWQLNPEAHLRHLGRLLASGQYRPQPMPLIPYAKSKGRLRHFCQPSVRDQVAFMVFGVLLAPIFESRMENLSFGNRWYRGLVRTDSLEAGDQTKPWDFRKWSLTEDQIYQPYRRAHGLFRRVASWTIDAMLNCPILPGTPTGNRVLPDDYASEMIPLFASPRYWEKLPRSEKVYWARFDLKYAFPSVRIDVLRAAARDLTSSTDDNSFEFIILEDSLTLYPQVAKHLLRSDQIVQQLSDYLCNCLEAVRYQPFENSDKLFFPDDANNPSQLPGGDGAGHPGLPTGLALSPILLNVYLGGIDQTMQNWLQSDKERKPAAFLRFADDMILLANDKKLLVDGIEVLMNAVEPPRKHGTDLNLRMNWQKSKPDAISKVLTKFRDTSLDVENPTSWLSTRQALEEVVAKSVVTKDSRDPFVTDLVERFSELGMERETDALPDNARLRLTRLQEIVVFQPNDEAVPRATQLVFTANKLVRTWLPEEDEQLDAQLLKEIRRSVAEALSGALDKPRLWRSVLRAALRRPIPSDKSDFKHIKKDAEHAADWLNDMLKRFARKNDGLWAKHEDSEVDDWDQVWPLFASFHRAAFWRATAETMREMSIYVAGQSNPHIEPMETESWFYRSFDEGTLTEAYSWFEQQIHRALEIFYFGELKFEPIPSWEASALGLALLSIVPRSTIAREFRQLGDRKRNINGVITQLASAYDEKLRGVTTLFSQDKSKPIFRGDFWRILWLARVESRQKVNDSKYLMSMVCSPPTLLRLADKFGHDAFPADYLIESARTEVESHDQRFRKARKLSGSTARAELLRYHRARRIFLGLGGSKQ